MATGVYFNNTCYSTAAEAVDTYFLSTPPSVTSGVTSYISDFVKVSNVWYMRTNSVSSTGVKTQLYTTVAPVPSMPTCDTLKSFNDGLVVGAGLLLAVITAVIFGIISKAK